LIVSLALTSAARYLYGEISVKYNRSGDPHMWLDEPSDVGKQLPPDLLKRVEDGLTDAPLSSDQSGFMKAIAKGPYMDAFVEFHDGLHELDYVPNNQGALIATMPPSYALTVAAAMQPYAYVYTSSKSKKRRIL